LAAGKGTRMNSPFPKVIHPVAGEPMIYRLILECQKAGAEEVRVVVGHGEPLVRQIVEPLGALCLRQVAQKGTGDAVRAAQPEAMEGVLIILNGDQPLIRAQDIKNLLRDFLKSDADLAVVTTELDEPGNYGRIVRHHGEIYSIVEAKDASHEALKIREVNVGVYLTHSETLREYLPRLKPNNTQGEFYLTDIVSLYLQDQLKVTTLKAEPQVAWGVNTQQELAMATKTLFSKKAHELMSAGVMIIDPVNTYIEEEVKVGEGAVIHPNVHLKGKTEIGPLCNIEPGCVITGSKLAKGVHVKANSYITDSTIDEMAEIGPFAHLRPKSEVGKGCKVGNFVEMKNTRLGDASKAGHLTYLGDAVIGKDVNIGCGTITANYAIDRKKYVTKIGDNVFVGSDSQFVAPIEVGAGAVIACGSTITKNVPAGALAVARGKQVIKENFKPKAK
jgi:bifunctional UDP-N-acetylglucosamine pyrophosphorylase/glucosamine-1-phosphate N-acetyltransferase